MAKEVTHFNVRGAFGDETREIQAAVDATEEGGTLLFISTGKRTGHDYRVTQPIIIRKSIIISADSSRVSITKEGPDSIFTIIPSSSNTFFRIDDLELIGSDVPIFISSSIPNSPQSELRNLTIRGFADAGIKVISPSAQLKISNVHISGGDYSIFCSASAEYTEFTLKDSVLEGADVCGFRFDKTQASPNSGSTVVYNTIFKNNNVAVSLGDITVSSAFARFVNNGGTVSLAGATKFVEFAITGAGGGGGGGVTDHGELTGLADNDHPQYTLRTDFNPVTASFFTFSGTIQSTTASLQSATGALQTVTGTLLAASATFRTELNTLTAASATFESRIQSLLIFSGNIQSATASLQAATGSIQTVTGTLLAASATFRSELNLLFNASGTFETRLLNLQSFSASIQSATASFQSTTASLQSATASLQTVSASYLAVSSSYNTISASYIEVSGAYRQTSASFIGFSGSHASRHLSGAADPINAQDLAGNGLAANRLLITNAAGGWTTIPSQSLGGGGGVTDHGDLTGLADDDHTQYILASGVRPMSGNLDVSNFKIILSQSATPVSASQKAIFYSKISPGLDSNTEFLCHFVNQGNGPVDVSSNALNIMTTASAVIQSDVYFFPPQAAALNLSVSNADSFQIANAGNALDVLYSDFTVECFVKTSEIISTSIIFGVSNGTANYFRVDIDNGSLQGRLQSSSVSVIDFNSAAEDLNDGRWHHVCTMRTGSIWYMFLDGISVYLPVTFTGSVPSQLAGRNWRIGNTTDVPGVGNSYSGFLTEFRISSMARYHTGGFEPPRVRFGVETLYMVDPLGGEYPLNGLFTAATRDF